MKSEDLYNHLTNFTEESLRELGFNFQDGFWIHPKTKDQFEVSDNSLLVYRGGVIIFRLNSDFNRPEILYKTFVDTGVIDPAVHSNYLREQGLKL